MRRRLSRAANKALRIERLSSELICKRTDPMDYFPSDRLSTALFSRTIGERARDLDLDLDLSAFASTFRRLRFSQLCNLDQLAAAMSALSHAIVSDGRDPIRSYPKHRIRSVRRCVCVIHFASQRAHLLPAEQLSRAKHNQLPVALVRE